MEGRLLVFTIVVLPIVSVCVGFTVHYAIRPLVETLVDALHELVALTGQGSSHARLMRLEGEVDALRAEVRRLRSGPAGSQLPSGANGAAELAESGETAVAPELHTFGAEPS